MKKLALLILLFVLAGASAQAQNIVKSLERNVPGQGKVTIHQDPRIEAMIGMERPATGEQKVMKGCLLYTSPSPRDRSVSRMPSSA